MSPVYGYVFNLFLVLVLVFCNAFFVVSEFAIVKIRRTKLEELAHAGSKRAKIALKINEHMNTYLSAIQLGITLASLGLGWLGEPAVSRLLEDLFSGFFADNKILLHSLSFGIAFTFITLLHVVFGELVPKSMAIQDTERYALIIAPPLYTFNKIFAPFIWVFDHVTMWILKLMGVKQADENEDAHSEEEIKLIIDASQKGGVIDDTESEIIQNAICFSEISAHEIMIPRQEMKCIYQNSSYNEVMEFVKQHKHTRFPLCNGDKDQIIGMIHIRDLLECKNSPHKDILSKIVRNILFVPENKSISEILHEMMKNAFIWRLWLTNTVEQPVCCRWKTFWKSWSETSGTNTMTSPRNRSRKSMIQSANLTGCIWLKTPMTVWGSLTTITSMKRAPWVAMSLICSGANRLLETKPKTIIAYMKLCRSTICGLPG